MTCNLRMGRMEDVIRFWSGRNSPVPPQEAARQRDVDLVAGRHTHIPELDQIAAAAAALIGAPAALVTIVDRDRLFMPGRFNSAIHDVPRAQSVCAHGILEPQRTLCVPDLLVDERFRDLDAVQSAEGLRFYLGAPLLSSNGHALGMLCVMDVTPRAPATAGQCRALQRLARAASARLQSDPPARAA